jgi:Fe2+ or Zn2+ uptake regulation protein
MMNFELSCWKEKLNEKGIKNTCQRMEILKVLLEKEAPLSARDIYLKIKGDNHKFRLSTVYRNLNIFAEKNIVRKLDLNEGKTFFELLTSKHHHHLICKKCGKIMAIKCPLGNYLNQLAENTGYVITDHKLKVYGICPDCK